MTQQFVNSKNDLTFLCQVGVPTLIPLTGKDKGTIIHYVTFFFCPLSKYLYFLKHGNSFTYAIRASVLSFLTESISYITREAYPYSERKLPYQFMRYGKKVPLYWLSINHDFFLKGVDLSIKHLDRCNFVKVIDSVFDKLSNHLDEVEAL